MKKGPKTSEIDKLLFKVRPHPVIALVDDETATLDLLKRVLESEGYIIHRFPRAEEFLEHFSEIRPDAILMEAILPGISGLSVLEQIRPKSLETIIPTMILSRKDDVPAKLLAFRRGAFDYVVKPFNPEEVVARVKALVRAKLIQEMLQQSSVSDPLTTLYNRRFLMIWLDREIERVRRYGLELSCMLVDLDRFREVNQTKGEPYGDHFLKEFSELLVQCTRRADIVGRIQDDEFLLFLPGTTKEQALNVAQRLRQAATERTFEWKGKKTSPSFSIGIVGCHAKEAPDPPAFLERAEEALQKAKSVGLNQTAVLSLN